MSIPVTNPDLFRANIARTLADLFQTKRDASSIENPESCVFKERIGQLSTAIEESIYTFAVQACKPYEILPNWDNRSFVTLYTCRFRSMYLNIQNDPVLWTNILDGTVSTDSLATIQHVDIAQQKWMPHIQQLMERDKYAQEKSQTSDLFVCPRCEKTRTTHYSLQTRGGDEPMTIFINCIDCDYKWTE